jgi:hypothetical protein
MPTMSEPTPEEWKRYLALSEATEIDFPTIEQFLAIEVEAVAAERERLREAVEVMPSGWTRPEDQFGPKQYRWLYADAVLALLASPVAPQPIVNDWTCRMCLLGDHDECKDHAGGDRCLCALVAHNGLASPVALEEEK